MKLNYVLVVNGPNYGAQLAFTAFRFAEALLARGHEISQIFFYQEGVTNASALALPANDEFDLVTAWATLARDNNIQLQTCVAASLRRGVISQDEADTHQLPAKNMANEFEQVGLGALAEAMLTADRLVQF